MTTNIARIVSTCRFCSTATMRLLCMNKTRLLGSLYLLLVIGAAKSAVAATLADGEWIGAIACGRMATQSPNPEPFQGNLSLSVQGGSIWGERIGPNFKEVFTGNVDRQGILTIDGEGSRLDNPTIIWRYRAKGAIESTRIGLTGAMMPWATQSTNSNVTRLRECSFNLVNANAERARLAEERSVGERLQLENQKSVERDRERQTAEEVRARVVADTAATEARAAEAAADRSAAQKMAAEREALEAGAARRLEAERLASAQRRSRSKAAGGAVEQRQGVATDPGDSGVRKPSRAQSALDL